MKMKMKILIIGGSGSIGINTVNRYLKKEFDVLNIDWNHPGKEEHLPYCCKLDIQ